MRHSILMLSLAAVLAVSVGCQRNAAPAGDTAKADTDAPAATQMIDEHSYAEPDKVKVKDLALELKLDFEKKVIDGSATLALDWLDKNAARLVLDTRDLSISKVLGERSDGKWEDLKYTLAPADKVLGSKLTIETPQRNPLVRIAYTT